MTPRGDPGATFDWTSYPRTVASRSNVPSMAVPLACEECSTKFPLPNPTDIDGSFRLLEARGWMHVTAEGLGRERWPWRCPSCKPTGEATTGGFTTGPMTTKKDDS